MHGKMRNMADSRYKGYFTKEHIRSLLNGILLLGLALIFQFYASAYAIRVASNSVSDIFLSALPIVNTNFVIVEGALLAIAISLLLLLLKPKYLAFAIKASAIFIATRAICVALTHIGIYPGQVGPDPTGIFDRTYVDLGLEGGYFFSGHTGFPVLLALIFWDEKRWRYAYLGLSVAFGIAVLFAHVHYSIDVFAAPFMAYGIFKLSQHLFAEDYRMTKD